MKAISEGMFGDKVLAEFKKRKKKKIVFFASWLKNHTEVKYF